MPNSIQIQYKDFHNKPHERVFSVSDTIEPILIGRRDRGHNPTINLSWNHSVSRRHLRIFYEYNAWHIEQISDMGQTVVNDTTTLVPGVPWALPAQAEIKVGGNSEYKPTLLRTQHDNVENEAPGNLEVVSIVYDARVEEDDPEQVESQRVEIFARMTEQLKAHDGTLLNRLLTEIKQVFPTATAGGIALYADRQIRIPVNFPHGITQMSFRLAHHTLRHQQTIRWKKDLDATSSSNNFKSLSETNEAIYVPLLRGYRKLGLLYLHTTETFDDGDDTLLQAIGDMLANHPDFDPDTAHLRMPSVFVSYSRKNKPFVQQLVNDVRRQRVSVWWDERLRAGKDWRKQIATAIHKSDNFALVMSPPSLASENVQWEIEQARLAHKPIIPLYYEDCDVPDELARPQRIAVDPLHYEDGVLELVETLYDYMDTRLTASVHYLKPVMIPKDEKVRILFLAANPTDTSQLRLGEEVRQIEAYLRSSKYRDRFELKSEWAVRSDDMRSAMLRYQPHIVHFSGHGSQQGEIILETNNAKVAPLRPNALKLLFEALKDDSNPAKNVQLVVFNACYSATQAEPIAEVVGSVVGMTRAVSDAAAIGFSSAFYESLGYGKHVQQAFNVGKAEMEFYEESEVPVLLAHGVDPTQLKFVDPE